MPTKSVTFLRGLLGGYVLNGCTCKPDTVPLGTIPFILLDG